MAIRWLQGWDWLKPSGTSAETNSLIITNGAAYSVSNFSGVGRFGIGQCLRTTGISTSVYSHLWDIFPSRIEGEFVIGFAIKPVDTFGLSYFEVALHDDRTGVNLVSVRMQDAGVFTVHCGGFDIGRTRPGLHHFGAWHYVQLKCTPGPLGHVQLKVDGEIVIDVDSSITNGTLPIGFNWGFDSWKIFTNGPTAASRTFDIDDMYILDTTGSAPYNDYLGNIRVGCMKPNAPGDQTDLIPIGAGTNWEAVTADYNVSSTDPTYVKTDTVGDYDLYNLQANVSTRQIFGIQMSCFYRQSDAIQLYSQNVMKTGGSEYFGDVRGCAQTFIARHTVWESNPDTGLDWTDTDLADLQIGPKLESSD